jgi:alpha-glucoside transport system substrate-binding protein
LTHFPTKRFLAALALIGLLLPSLANRTFAATQHAPAAAGGPVTIFGQWAGTEKSDFQAILNYCDKNYGTKATYQQSAGDYVTELTTRVQGGNPPDVGTLSTPSSIGQFVAGGALQPLSFVNSGRLNKQYSSFWRKLGTINGKLYAIYMKADVKSLVWYSPKKFKAGKYAVPKKWSQLIALSKAMMKKGQHPWAFGASDGWTLTDFFENVFLQSAGTANYQKLIDHKISWTSAPVKKAFALMNQIVANNGMIAGGRQRALSQKWDQGAKQMVTDPSAQFFQEATFVGAGLKQDLPSDKAGRDYNNFPFPLIKSYKTTPTEVGPNGIVMFKDTPGSRALISCLTDPKALAEWAKLGGFISPNNVTPLSAYPDALTRAAAKQMIAAGKANLLVGDGSDLMPTALGSDFEFTALQKWFKTPSSTNSVLASLESEANKVYKK